MTGSNIKSYSIFGTEKWEAYFTYQIYDYFIGRGYNARVRNKMEFCLDALKSTEEKYGAIRKYIIIQEDSTKRFFCIDHADQYDYMSEKIASHFLCIGILKCQYREGSYGYLNGKISSFVYGVKEKEKYFDKMISMRGVKKENKPMYFKGNETWGRSNILKLLSSMSLINKDYGFRDCGGNRNLKIPQEEYLMNMAQSRIVFSLPGVGNCCHREIEAFGIGSVVLMPVLKNSYYNNLIPDKHYLAVDTSSIIKNKFKEYNKEDEQVFCEMVKKRYEESVDDDSLLDRIRNDSIQWFENNIRFPFNMVLMEEILKEKFGYVL